MTAAAALSPLMLAASGPDRPDLGVVAALAAQAASARGLDLVRVAWFGGGGDDAVLQIMAERPATRQLTIDDCAALSHALSDALDALEADGRDPGPMAYRLEVSSPGIDRPLTRPADFADWTGHAVKVALKEKLDGRQRFNGELVGLDAGRQAVVITDKEGVQHVLPIDAIETAKLVLTDRLIAATAVLSAAGADELEPEEEGQE